MRTKALSSKRLILLAVALVLLAVAFAFTFNAGATELDGMSFTAADHYKMEDQVMPDGPITFEAEIYLPDAYHTERSGAILSNYKDRSYLGAYAFEILANGKVRAYSWQHGDVTIDYDITKYMGTDSAPEYVQIAVTVDTETGAIVLYVNGKQEATATNLHTARTKDMYNTTQTFDGTEVSNLLCIGGDERSGNAQYFKGKIKNVAMYKGVRDYTTATYFDTSDENMLFGYDMTKAYDGFLPDQSANKNHANNTNWTPTEGMTFEQAANIPYLMKDLEEAPYTYEAVIWAPLGMTENNDGKIGAIIANYPDKAGDSFLFQVRGSGQPSIFITDDGTNRINHKFNYDIRRSAFVHLAITHETDGTDSIFKCYVDGELVDTITKAGYVPVMDMEAFAATRRVSIGHCGRANLYYKGNIKSIALHNRPLSASEIKALYQNGTDATDDSVIACYDLTNGDDDGYISDLSGNGYNAATDDWAPSDGRTFAQGEDSLYMAKDLEEMPYSYEAVVYAPLGVSRPGPILANYPDAGGDSFMFDIYTGGKPNLYIYDSDVVAGKNFTFNYDVRSRAYVHIVITLETVGTQSLFKCYVDGEQVDTITYDGVFTFDLDTINATGPINLGHCGRASLYNQGNIKSAALHNKVLSADEVRDAYENGSTVNSDSFIAYYDFTGDNATSMSVEDESGNGYELKPMFYEKDFVTEDYDYSFAVVGDTQFMIWQDAVNGTHYTDSIYNWIVKNYGAKKMKYVFGLGDIIDNGKLSDGTTSSASTEWAYAKELITSTLGANNIPYSLIAGNHDFMRPKDTGYQSTFGNETTLTKNITGYYVNGEVYNYYMNFDVGDTPYMLLALEYGANDDILTWANDIIAQNRHRRVIITTHGYMNRDGTTLDGDDWAAPKPTGTTNENYLKYNNGDEMWDEMVKLHPNVIMVLSGHIDPHNIVMREDQGIYGNTVQQFLIDPQAMDKYYSYNTGMVAMFYFRNGGKDVSVEYVSTCRTESNGGKEVLFNPRNQFDFTIEESPKQTDKGEINVWLIGGQSNAAGYANGLSAEQMLDSRYTNGFDNILYYGYSEKWQSNFIPLKAGLGKSSSTSGAELGIAELLGNTGEMNAVIKYAQGATALYPTTEGDAAVNYGTWTSPSYISKYGTSTDGNKTGDLYVNFINTVNSAIAELERMGYTPVIKGMWWMQGEEETYNGGASSYTELLQYLVKDVRTDLSVANMPFIIGKVFTSSTGYADLEALRSAQEAFAAADEYADIVDPNAYASFAQQDNWHFDAATQGYLGRSFIEKACAINGDIIVRSSNNYVNFTGGGLYPKTSTDRITVGLAPSSDNMKIMSVTKKVGAADAQSVALADGKYSFNLSGESVTFDVTLDYDGVDTDYGIIPAEFAESGANPVILFDGNGFVGAYTEFGTAVTAAAQKDTDGDFVILLRDNANQSVNGKLYGDNYVFSGTLTVDLGGYILYRGNTATYVIDAFYDVNVTAATANASITVKNGAIVNNGNFAMFCVNYGGKLAIDATLDYTFDNVRFSSSSVGRVIFETWDNGGSIGNKVLVNTEFTDCVFDYTGAAANEVMLYLSNNANGKTVFDVSINGGKIISDRTIGIANIATKDSLDSVKFGKSDSGYTICELASGISISTESFNAVEDGKTLSFGEGVNNVYALGENVKTAYGTIPYKYTDADSYPFAVFRNGSFIGAYPNWGIDSGNSALSESKAAGSGSVVLMRRNFTNPAGTQYNNLSQTVDVTIDLGGFIFDSRYRSMFLAQKKTANDTTITVKNGSVLLGSNALLTLDTWDPSDTSAGGKESWAAYKGGNGFNITYENVNISLISGATTTDVICYNTFLDIDPEQFLKVTFTNCVFDLSKASTSLSLFDMTNALCITTAVMNGGKIITSGQTVTFADMTNANDSSSLTFSKTEGGSYTTLHIPEGSSLSVSTVNDGELTFIKSAVKDGTVIYSLVPASATEGFTTKANITLDSNLIFNIYLPTTKSVVALALNGEEREIKVEDGYYVISESLKPYEAAKTLTLEVTIDVDGTKLKGTFTFSTLAYAESVYASTTNENEITLVSDVLAYIKSAYTYFEKTDEAAMAKIDELLLAHPASAFPETVYPVNTISGSFADVKAITFVLKDTPALKLYLENEVEADSLTYSIGGRELAYTTGEDATGNYVGYTYVIITGYAHLMTDTITVSRKTPVEGEVNSGDINLEAYYYLASNGGTVSAENSTLVDIVEKFYNYCTSAKAYRNSVMNPDANA